MIHTSIYFFFEPYAKKHTEISVFGNAQGDMSDFLDLSLLVIELITIDIAKRLNIVSASIVLKFHLN